MSSSYESHRKDTKVIEFRRDGVSGILKPSTIPTDRIRPAIITRYPTMDIDKVMGSITSSGTAPLRITYMNMGYFGGGVGEIAWADRDGTFDTFLLGSSTTVNGQAMITLKGDTYNPLHVVQGTLRIYNASGSVANGTYFATFEGVQ